MADVIMPQMGESIAEGTVTKWLKNVGDPVERDEPLFEISTDKVDAEIPSPAAGVLREIRVAPGTTVPVNTVVGVIAAEAEAATAPPAARRPPRRPPRRLRAPLSPTGTGARCAPRTLHVRLPPLDLPTGGEASGRVPSPTAGKTRAAMTAEELRQVRSSPVVRKIAAEHQVDLREIPGTGIGGRVTKQDILGHIEGAPVGSPAAPAEPPAPRPRPRLLPPLRPRPKAGRGGRPRVLRAARASRSSPCRRSARRPRSTWCSRSAPRPTSRPSSRST